MSENTEKKSPSHRVYYAKQEEGFEGPEVQWVKLGAAFPHADGKGFDVVLESMPIGEFDGRLTLAAIEPKKPKEAVA